MQYPIAIQTRFPAILVFCILPPLLAGCCLWPRELQEEPAVDGEAPPEPELKMEENGGEVFRQMDALQVGFLSAKTGLRTISWREARPDGTLAPKIRLSIGFWAEGFAGQLLGEHFQEEKSMQLSLDQCNELIDLINAFHAAQFKEPGDHIKYRGIRANYGMIRLRKTPEGNAELHITTDENLNEAWVKIDPEDFAEMLKESIERAKTLRKSRPSVDWN